MCVLGHFQLFVIPRVRMIKSMASNWINDVKTTLRGWTNHAEKRD